MTDHSSSLPLPVSEPLVSCLIELHDSILQVICVAHAHDQPGNGLRVWRYSKQINEYIYAFWHGRWLADQ